MYHAVFDGDVMAIALSNDDHGGRGILEQVAANMRPRCWQRIDHPLSLGDVFEQTPHGDFSDAVFNCQTSKPAVQDLVIRNARNHRRYGDSAIASSSLVYMLHRNEGRTISSPAAAAGEAKTVPRR